MSLLPQERYDVVAYRLEKALQTLEQAKANVPLGYWELVANRLYYAAYYAVSALLIANGYNSKSHDGTIRLFGLHFVNEGIVSSDLGKHFRRLFQLRLTGDYSDNVLSLFEPIEKLITTVSELTKQALNNKIS